MTSSLKKKSHSNPIYTKRVQTVLTEAQYELLLNIAEEKDMPVSVLIREAITTEYFRKAQLEQRRTALENLLSLESPVADWEKMEKEITKGAMSA